MRNSIVFISLFLFLSCSVNTQLKTEDENIIRLDYDFYLIEDGLVRFDIDYFIPYSKLIFRKEYNSFNSDITLSVEIIEYNKEILYNNSWSENIHVDYFEETKSQKDYIGHFTFTIEEKQSYLIKLSINDYTNHKYYKYEQTLTTSPYQYLSDIKLYIKDNGEFLNVDNMENSKLENLDTLWIKYQIIDDNISDNPITFEIINNNISDKNKLRYSIDSSKLSNYTVDLYPLSLGEMPYKSLTINCYYKDVHKFKSIRILDKGKIDFDYTILFDSMKNYIFNREEYVEYIDLDSTKKVDYIKNYWLKRNNPNLLIEFYKRVKYSNINFKKIGTKGSNSDQGKIYIIYGKPLNIDFEFNESGEFEIWQYRNKKFIFINRFGYYECYRC